MKLFLVSAAFSSVAADCMDGNNGGCSHYCSMVDEVATCTCPPCWDLNADNECHPSSDHLHVSCSATEMSVSIDECVYQDDVDLVWSESDCSMASHNNTSWGITTALDGCGTAATAADGVISFSNSVVVEKRHNPLKMFPDPQIFFTCDFDADVNVSTSHSVDDGTQVTDGQSANGSFEFSLNMVVPDDGSGDGFSIAPDTDVVTVGERVHFQISNNNPLEGVHFFVNECSVSDGVSTHSVFTDNCGGSSVQATIDGATHAGETVQGSYIAFVFSQSAGNTMDLTCSVYACLAAECEDMMNTCDGRRRRSALPGSALYYVSKSFNQK
jgi:hypothetical protein